MNTEMTKAPRAGLAEQLLIAPATKVVQIAESAAEIHGGILRHPLPHLGIPFWKFEALGITGTGSDNFAAVMHWCRKVRAADERDAA